MPFLVQTSGCIDLRRVDQLARHFVGLQRRPHLLMHVVRHQDTKSARELQRGQVHRLHYVQHVHHLDGLCAHLFRNAKWLRGKFSFPIHANWPIQHFSNCRFKYRVFACAWFWARRWRFAVYSCPKFTSCCCIPRNTPEARQESERPQAAEVELKNLT